jgi:opacity protein-like surface antigen
MWMMKRFAVSTLALAFGLVAFAGNAEAQVPVRPFTIGISGGPTLATGEFRDEAGTGYHVQGSLGFGLPMLPLGLRVDALWQELPASGADGMFRQIGGLLNGTFGIPLGIAQPYGLIGGGVIAFTSPDLPHGDHAHEGETETGFGFNAGIGIEFPFVGMNGVIEARYLGLFGGHAATEHQSIPISFGIRF